MVLPSCTLMATVLAFRILGCFSSLRATIERVPPVFKTTLSTRSFILMVIKKTQSSSAVLPPYPSSRKFTPPQRRPVTYSAN